MTVNLEDLAKDLKNIVGEEHAFSNLVERTTYAEAIMPFDVEEADLPDIVVHPANTQEISKVLQYANKHEIPVTIFGSGTSNMLGSKPKHRGITLSTERLNFIQIDEDSQWFECGVGAKTGDVIRELGKLGYFLPIQTQIGSSIGGAVSINTTGHLTDNIFGRPVNNVLGLEIVLPTGEIIQTGSKSLRRAVGWDLTRIFVGAEGVLGVITKVRMVLRPMPEIVDVVGFFKTAEQIGHAMALMYKKKVPLPLDGEFTAEKGCEWGFKKYGVDAPKGAAMFIARCMGRTAEEASKNARELVELLTSAGAIESYVLDDNEIREKLWAVREKGISRGRDLGLSGFVPIEVNPPLPRLSEAMTELKHISEGRKDLIGETESFLYGHVGADSLHCVFWWPHDWSNEKAKQLVMELWDLENKLQLKYEGVAGDWGQIPYRLPFYRERYGETSYEIIKKMKQLFDPNNILNRGNVEGEI